jgi:hypothetical protein
MFSFKSLNLSTQMTFDENRFSMLRFEKSRLLVFRLSSLLPSQEVAREMIGYSGGL